MRIFWCSLFILMLMCSTVFAQTEQRKAARKFFEFGKISNSLLKEKVEDFYTELRKNADSQGYIFNYGTDKEVTKREKQIRNSMNFREQDSARITFVRGGNNEKLKTVLWIVPEGAETPIP